MACLRFGFSTKVRKLMKNEELRMKNFCGNGGQRAHNEGEGGVERLAGWRWYAWSVGVKGWWGGDAMPGNGY